MRDTFLIVDGNSLMHRAFHALPLMDYNGTYTNALHGFLNMLLRCLRERAPRYCAVAFDEHAPTFRHTEYAEYKAGRARTPDELRPQFDSIKEILTAMGLGVLSLTGYEADDILGTLSLQCREKGIDALLLTGDRDALQLVDDEITLLLTRKGISEVEECTPARVKELFGVTPAQITDLKGLMGDSSDNIPGVPGVGEKTAVKLLDQYETLENVLAHGDEIKGKLGEKVRGNADQARFSKWLATIKRDIPLTVRYDACETHRLSGGVGALRKYGLNTIATRVLQEQGEEAVVPEEAQEIRFSDWAELTADSAAKLCEASADLAVFASEEELTLCGGPERLRGALGGQVGLFDLPGMGGDPLQDAAPAWQKPLITHDGKHLLHLLDDRGLPLPEIAFDTMLAAYALNPQEKSYHLSAFADADASGVWALRLRQQAQMRALDVEKLYREIELPLMRVLFDMERVGFQVDTDVLREIGARLSARENELRDSIYALCGVGEFNINSPKQLGEVLFEKLGLKAGRKTSKGFSTDAETLENLREAHPAIPAILEYRQVSKLHGTYIDALIRKVDGEGRIHTFFDQTGTATGRISSAEPNLQNIPVRTDMGREIRRAFVAKPGCVLIDADYSQIELRILAHFSGDPAMVDAFRQGQDIHARTAAEVAGIDIAEVTPQMRSHAKAVNFGLVYGISDFGLARNTGMSRKEAAAFIERYFAAYPGVKAFMDQKKAEGYAQGEIRTLFGRIRKLPELKSSNYNMRSFGERAAMNTPVQGTAADIIKLAMVRVYDALQKAGLQSKLILQVHDELILEAPEQEAEAASRLLKECMENVITLSVPLVAEVKTGHSWYETK